MTAPFYALIVPQEATRPPGEPGEPPIDTQKRCGTCVSFKDGHCWFLPPTVLMTAPVGGATAGDAKSFRPEVNPDTDWCSQWRPTS